MPAFTDKIAESLIKQLSDFALDGVGPLDPAHQVADEALEQNGSAEEAIDAVVAEHLRLAAMNGFVTGLGGFVTLPVSVPANIVGFYTLATRMVAAVARLRGHNLDLTETRVAVLAALAGDDISSVMEKAGLVVPGVSVTTKMLRRLAPSATLMVNKAVGFRLLVGTGERLVARLGRSVPVLGGAVGGALDVVLMRSIAGHAKEQFLPDAVLKI